MKLPKHHSSVHTGRSLSAYLFSVAQIFSPLCSERKTLAAFCLSLPVRNERGESRREGKLIKSASSPQPSPPFLRRRGRENAVARSKQTFYRAQLAKNLRSSRPQVCVTGEGAFTLPEVLIATALGVLMFTWTMAFMAYAGKSLSGAATQTFLNQQAGTGTERILSRVRFATSISTDVDQNTLTLGFDDNYGTDGSDHDGKPYNDVDHLELFQFQNGGGDDNTIADNVLVYIPSAATTNILLRSVRKLPGTPVFSLTNLSTVVINLGVADTYADDWRQSAELQLIAVPRNRTSTTNIVSILP